MNEKNSFIAQTQAWLSYLFVGGFFVLRILEGIGWMAKDDDNTIVQALMLVLAFWFMRERGTKPEDQPIPPGGTSTTTTEKVTTTPAVAEVIKSETTTVNPKEGK